MSYKFQGVFTRDDPTSLGLTEPGYAVLNLRPRYAQWGIKIRDEKGTLEQTVLPLLALGLRSGLALDYSTWAGPIDRLVGFRIEAGKIVEASRFSAESWDDDAESLFMTQMSDYGLSPEDGGYFAPFDRSGFPG